MAFQGVVGSEPALREPALRGTVLGGMARRGTALWGMARREADHLARIPPYLSLRVPLRMVVMRSPAVLVAEAAANRVFPEAPPLASQALRGCQIPAGRL